MRSPDDERLVGHLMRVAGVVAREQGLRILDLSSITAQAPVRPSFIYIHVIGGRGLHWPPG